MIEEIKYFLIGFIQGLTEFFPISSSGHIELYKHITNIVDKDPLLLVITVHFATALSTMVIYRHKIKVIICSIIKTRDPDSLSFILKLIISTIPIVFVYILIGDSIEVLFQDSLYLVATMLLFTAVLLITSSWVKNPKNKISYGHALLMGIAQSIAILPGVSRSGSTISIALFCKIERERAAEFSFLMGLAPIIGGTIIKILNNSSEKNLETLEIQALAIAFFSAFFSGLFACKYMITIVQRNNLRYFGYYCLIVGIGSIIVL